MSYVVLARKYRPKTFADMVGQEHVVQALGNALTSQRLHHAYLFTGTRGVGKTTVSRILAKSLNCLGADGQGGITAEPCGVCQACQDIDSGRFVDYTELDAASNRGVDEVQALLEQAVYKPVQGRFKVFMIDEVHMLTNTAFNAMLKTLEEPPEYLKFVLATTDPQKVPVTVLSRCLQFNLRPMLPQTIESHLGHVLQQEHIAYESGALKLLGRFARGSMRDALSLTDQAIAFGGGQLQEATVRQMLGAVDQGYVLQMIEALAQADGAAVVQHIDAMRLQGLSPAAALDEMIGVLQHMAVLQLAGTRSAHEAQSPEVAALAEQMPPDDTQLLYSLCLHGKGELGLAPDEYAALTMLLLRLLAFRAEGSTQTPAEKKTLKKPVDSVAPSVVARPVAATASNPVVIPASTVAAPVIEPAPALEPAERVELVVPVTPVSEPMPPQSPCVDESDLGNFWYGVVQQLIRAEAINALTRELALQAILVERQLDRWSLLVSNASLMQSTAKDRLQQALQAQGYAVQLHITVGTVQDSPAQRNVATAKARMAEAEASLRADPFVQSLMRDFGGKIVPGTIQPLNPTKENHVQ
jgi:DNA polymerase III subunit gamma/tau